MNERSFISVRGETAMTAKRSTSTETTLPQVSVTPLVEPATKGERTRAALLDAARRLFVRNGYHGTSMRQIADEAGLALGGIYNHFGKKEDIFVGVLMERHPFLVVMPALQAAQGQSVETLLRDAAQRMLAELSQNQDFLNLMFIELVEFEAKHIPALFEVFFPPLMQFAQQLEAARGPLRDIPLPIVLRSFLGLFFSYFITDLIMGSQMPEMMKAGAFDHFIDIYLHGILAAK
jgi:AcrR family transcriptional regulator